MLTATVAAYALVRALVTPELRLTGVVGGLAGLQPRRTSVAWGPRLLKGTTGRVASS